jgi:DNA polymerase eta
VTSLSLGVSGIETVTTKAAGSLDFFLVRKSATSTVEAPPDSPPEDSLFVSDDECIKCERCKQAVPVESYDEHMDWHLAKDLQAEEDRAAPPQESMPSPQKLNAPKARSKPSPVGPSKKPKVVKGNQTLLNFFQPREK